MSQLPTVPADGGLLLLTASPRPGGNSDRAAALFAQGFAAEGQGIESVHLRDYRVTPCTGCGACAALAVRKPDTMRGQLDTANLPSGGAFLGCPPSRDDDSRALLGALARCRALCIVSPIYFYHLPAGLKALVDRLQVFWELRQSLGRDLFERRPCFVILLGARSQGHKLFDGSLLTLRYALEPLNLELADPLTLYGLDAPGDLDRREDARQLVLTYGAEAFRRLYVAG
jgi:multimeric flavodoxin WrbA